MARTTTCRPGKTFTSSQLLKNNRYPLTQKARAKRDRLAMVFLTPDPRPLIPAIGGAGRDRTDDPLLAKQVLSQLSYSPASGWWVWMDSNHRPPPYQDGALTS